MTNNNQKKLAALSFDMDNLWSYMKTHGDAGWESYPTYFDILIQQRIRNRPCSYNANLVAYKNILLISQYLSSFLIISLSLHFFYLPRSSMLVRLLFFSNALAIAVAPSSPISLTTKMSFSLANNYHHFLQFFFISILFTYN